MSRWLAPLALIALLIGRWELAAARFRPENERPAERHCSFNYSRQCSRGPARLNLGGY